MDIAEERPGEEPGGSSADSSEGFCTLQAGLDVERILSRVLECGGTSCVLGSENETRIPSPDRCRCTGVKELDAGCGCCGRPLALLACISSASARIAFMSTLQYMITHQKENPRAKEGLYLGGVDLAFHGPTTFGVLPSSSRSAEALTATSKFKFKGGTRASSMQNKSSLVLARSGVRGTTMFGLLGVPGDTGCCCDGLRLALGDIFGCAFGCERTIGRGISCAASHSRCSSTNAARLTGRCRRENGDFVAWCPCTALASCLICQGDKSSSNRASSKVSILTAIN